MTEPKRDEEFEFTPAHRAAATLAHANGKVIVIDPGPKEPVAAKHEGERTEAEIEAENHRLAVAKREHANWHKLHDKPVAVSMDKIDADHAVHSDPERYIAVPRGLRAPVTLEERVTKLEQRLGPGTQEEIEARAERDAKTADRRPAERT